MLAAALSVHRSATLDDDGPAAFDVDGHVTWVISSGRLFEAPPPPRCHERLGSLFLYVPVADSGEALKGGSRQHLDDCVDRLTRTDNLLERGCTP